MFKLLGILLLIVYVGYIASEYGNANNNNNTEEIVYRYRPTTDITNLVNESFLRTHYDMFQKNPLLNFGEYTQEILDKIDDNLDTGMNTITLRGNALKKAKNICKKCYVKKNNNNQPEACVINPPFDRNSVNWLDNENVNNVSCTDFKDFHCSICDEFIDTFSDDKKMAVLTNEIFIDDNEQTLRLLKQIVHS